MTDDRARSKVGRGAHAGNALPPKPDPMPVLAENIPEWMRRLRRWVCWSWEWNGKKWDKPPRRPNGNLASTTETKTWCSFEEALQAHREGRFDGIGIVLGDLGDGRVLSGVDLDDVRDPEAGALEVWAEAAVNHLRSRAEVSPSRRGAKVLTFGRLPPGERVDHERGIAMYDGGRYFTLTGHLLPGSPLDVRDCEAALLQLHAEFFPPARQSPLSDRELALSALAGMKASRADEYWPWLKVGMALHAVDPSASMLAEWDRWSRHSENYGECERKWKSFGRRRGYTLGSLIYWARQDGWTPPARDRAAQHNTSANPGQVQPYDPAFITSAEFADGDYRLSWLVNHVMVKGQPCVVGGPKKALKTSILVDLAVSLAGGRKFLGEWYVPEPVPVAVLSGESGEAVLQETANRVAAAKGLRLRDLDILWGFRLPQLSEEAQVLALRDALRRAGVRVLLFDPLYLALLAGQGPEGLSASNLYQVGPLLLSVARSCLDVGCTPALVHHFKITRKDAYAEPQLEDLAYAGVQEFARQWILIGRRSAFDPDGDDGKHELWLSAGGSAGHGVLRAVDVYEGRLGEDFGGRTWRVEVFPAADARAAENDGREAEKERRKESRQRDDEAKALAAVDKLDPDREGKATLTKIRRRCQDMGVSRDRTDRALDRLVEEGILAEVEVLAAGGGGTKQTARGYRRPPKNGDVPESGG